MYNSVTVALVIPFNISIITIVGRQSDPVVHVIILLYTFISIISCIYLPARNYSTEHTTYTNACHYLAEIGKL